MMQLSDAAEELDNWLDAYGKCLGFKARQALIPLRDFLFSYSPKYSQLMREGEGDENP